MNEDGKVKTLIELFGNFSFRTTSVETPQNCSAHLLLWTLRHLPLFVRRV